VLLPPARIVFISTAHATRGGTWINGMTLVSLSQA